LRRCVDLAAFLRHFIHVHMVRKRNADAYSVNQAVGISYNMVKFSSFWSHP